MEVSPPTSSNASSQPEGSTSDSISGGFSAVTVAVTAGRPTPTPSPSPASAASALSNSAIPTASQPQPSNVAENSTNDLSKGDEAVKNDSSSHLTFSIASTPTPAANYSSSWPMPMHNESVIATPGPATSFEMNLLGQEILAASSTASAMMDGHGYDGFGSNDGSKAMTHYLRKDDFALPPFLQVHLDETYHASSSSSMLVLPPIPANIEVENKQQGGVLFRLSSNGPNLTPAHKTASTPINVTALGTAPPNPIGRRVAVNNGNVHTSNSMATLARANSIALANTSALYTSTSSIKHRSARSLPLRKRSFREEEDETETMIEARPAEENVVKRSSKTRPKGLSTKKPSVKKATLVRHNYNDSRSTCKCKKSQCLKLYCDCFQSGRMCDPNLCECVSCMNTEEYDGPNGKRTQAIDECMTKNPKAFEKRQKSIDEGCGCKKNK